MEQRTNYVHFVHRRLAGFDTGFDGFDTGFDTPFGHSTRRRHFVLVSIRGFDGFDTSLHSYSTQVATQPGASTQVAGLTELRDPFAVLKGMLGRGF